MPMRYFLVLILLLLKGALPAHAQITPVQPLVRVSFASSDTRFSQDQAPQVPQQNKWEATAWKGEKVQTQLLVWTKRDIGQLRVKISDLTSGKGNRIGADNGKAGFVRYVLTDEFGEGCGHRKTTDFDSSLVADPIDTVTSIAVQKNTLQPVWLSIQVPANTPAGKYKGVVTVQADKPYTLQVALTVQNRVLPPASQWAFDLDLWQHPAAIARVHGVPLWSPEHYRYMQPYYEMLAAAGQKSITTSIIDEPWNHQTYDDFPGLIKWIKQKDGTWTYDYSLFDAYVAFVMRCGIKERINCYTMIPWKLSFPYYDAGSGKDAVLVAKPGSAEYNAFWASMLKDFARHLKQKGWFGITSISMDERPMPDMQAVIELLKSVDPGWKITMAGDYHPEIEPEIFDYSLAVNWTFDAEALKRRKAQEKPSTFYTSCSHALPNAFTFSPPAEQAWLGWYAASKGFTGYLRWAYNSWVQHPAQDSRFRTWPAGDTYQVYPGPMSSIRFEKLKEGIQDFEKIRLLREEFRQKGDQQKLGELDRILAAFELPVLEKKGAAATVQQAKAALNKL
ncbi:DUF4091 domain-containing protein [Pontibacter liquoris]|uniref:DUF4091 domain-containing protein n=1 Tax=Pontibacter liquoris TaxID=2905677 RepID=UPI001FA6CDA5|nr:glycoside hydrolase domain-containing protein [Pontibacter liquoris]